MVAPKQEWTVIDGENSPHAKVFFLYLLPLALVPTIASFIGARLFPFIGNVSIIYFLYPFMIWCSVTYLTAFVINMLAGSFGANKNFDKAFSLVAYSLTPALVGGIFYIIPMISFVAIIAALYSLYLLYVGLQPMMKQPTEKTTNFYIVSLLFLFAVYSILSLIFGFIIV